MYSHDKIIKCVKCTTSVMIVYSVKNEKMWINWENVNKFSNFVELILKMYNVSVRTVIVVWGIGVDVPTSAF